MIFNSLGSNYNFQFVLKSLFDFALNTEIVNLKSFLENKYNGEATLLYKGREALKLALDILNLPIGSAVGVTGFTCFVVNQAIVDSGNKPVYIDINKLSLNFLPTDLGKYKSLKVLIVQNTLGNPSKIVDIKNFCTKNNIYLIEDLAHCVGTTYGNGIEAGAYGDFVTLSFSQDKVIDAVSGGALIVRNTNFKNMYSNFSYAKVDFKTQVKDRIYPFLTFLIRKTYPVGLGKFLHFLLKKLNVLSQPVLDNKKIVLHNLPRRHAYLANFQFSKLKGQLEHRNKISKVYATMINKSLMSDDFIKNLKNSSNLRFPIFSKKRTDLIKHLLKFGTHISDIWYDAPIAPKKFLTFTTYSNNCPVSEEVSENIVNLPTHINVSVNEAKIISDNINKWLNIQ